MFRIIDFNRAEPTCSVHQFRLIKWSFFVHITTRNAPYIHPSSDLILELWRTFPNELTTCIRWYRFSDIIKLLLPIVLIDFKNKGKILKF